tara:strand:- start:304 stop:957 length:654 start_codon:yes stop_codon:yes gene_type:complete
MEIDLYYTMRSPYCYLSTPTIAELAEDYDLSVRLKPVYPLAVSDKTFFEKVNPLWLPYVAKDVLRISDRLGVHFARPRPDPIVQDMVTREVAESQPFIKKLTHYAQIASEKDKGLDYVVEVSAMMFNPAVDGWDKGEHLGRALERAGLDISEFEKIAVSEEQRLESAVLMNRQDQLEAGHWGAPLFVHGEEAFFGQDRIQDLVWHLKKAGLNKRKNK